MNEQTLREPAPRNASIPNDNVIVAENLNIMFDTNDHPISALQDVNLNVQRGDFISLIGPSGCGKTTLLRAIADLTPVTSGHLRVNGMSPHTAREARAYGYVFQAPVLLPWRTVLRNVTLPLEIAGMAKSDRIACARENLALVGLKDFSMKFPWQLSGGMQQRVSIARALSFKPSLLLMDEPFGALDEITRDSLNVHLHDLWRRTGMTTIFVTHSIPEAVFLSTRIVVMSARPGRILRVIESDLPMPRSLGIRDTAAFTALAHDLREALRDGHSYD
ncbi:MAG: ABC transporter ATP-binding protein [Acidocella sp.]|nr:ABC transporter ATP-binding protein [Acidocella sp.]